jgi:hypothetical protein
VPIAASGKKTARIVKGAELKVYKGGSHGLAQVDPEIFNADPARLLALVSATCGPASAFYTALRKRRCHQINAPGFAAVESACNQQLRPFSPLLQESIVPSVKAVALPLLTVKQWPA